MATIQKIALLHMVIASALAAPPTLAQSIVQRDEKFRPTVIELKRGQTLTVTNEDSFVHHVFVESEGMKYDSGEQRPGRVLSIKFDTAGEYVLECAIHLKMKLKVIVRE
jgi:plastocyanin